MSNDDVRQAAEEALRAFPLWPFNTLPFVKFGTWWLLRKYDRSTGGGK